MTTDPSIQELLQDTLLLLQELYPVLPDPPQSTQDAAISILCHRLRYALQPDGEEESDDLFPWEAEDPDAEWDQDPEAPVGEEFRPYGWTPFLWADGERADAPEVDAAGRCFTDADPGL